jgi:hypothetical protein
MRESFQIICNNCPDDIIKIFADPSFLLSNLLGVKNIELKDNGTFVGELTTSTLLGKSRMIINGRVISSLTSATYIVDIVGYGANKGGKINVKKDGGIITIELDLSLPFEIANKGVIMRHIAYFRNNFNEIIRLERIKRKI